MNLASPSVRVSCLFGMLSIAALTGFAPPAGAQISEWDHYKVYRVSPSITDGRTILLRDQFISSQHTVFTLDWFANPTEKQLSDGTAFRILDPRTHYSWWRINGPPINTSVLASNQFGDQSLDLFNPEYLLNPALKNEVGPLPVQNHYKCYRCFGPPVGRQVTLVDQFGEWSATATVPRYFCTPTDKTVSEQATFPIVEPNRHYVCYELQPPDPRFFSATILDQFLPQDPLGVQLDQAQFLCVPTDKVDPTPTLPETWGRLKILYR